MVLEKDFSAAEKIRRLIKYVVGMQKGDEGDEKMHRWYVKDERVGVTSKPFASI